MRRWRGPVSLVSLLLAAACARHQGGDPSQVLAVVDGSEVTAPMLEAALAALPPGADPKDGGTQKWALEQLVSEVLLARKAEAMKLDRTPAVSRALEAARRRVLAEAYLDDAVGEKAPTELEIVSFYGQHPYLFSDRHRYDLDVVQVRSRPEQARPYITAFEKPGMTVGALAQQMNGDGVAAIANHRSVTADQLPDVLARRLATAPPGTGFTFRQGDVQLFVQVISAASDPVPLAMARRSIADFLVQQRRVQLGTANVRQLRAAEAVRYQPLGRKILAAPASPPPDQAGNT